MKIQFITGLLICSLLFSCKALISKYYHLNREVNFKDGEEYLNYIEKNKKIDRSLILLPDSTTYDAFLWKVVGNRLGYYYGAYLNDSIAVRRSGELEENSVCLGRVLTNMSVGLESIEKKGDTLLQVSDFNSFKFFEAKTGNQYDIGGSSKPIKIFLLYSYSTGSLFDKSYKEIFRFAEKNKEKVELRIIPTDRIMYKK